MHDSHLDHIISLVEVEQLMSGPRNRDQLWSYSDDMSEKMRVFLLRA